MAQKEQIVNDVIKEREQLAADEIYVDECDATLRAAVESGEMSSEQYNREMAALDAERQRIKTERDNLDAVITENDAMTSEELETLQAKRASQVQELNDEKSSLKAAISEWEELLGRILSEKASHLSAAKERVSSLSCGGEEVQSRLDEERDHVTDREKALQLSMEQVSHCSYP